MARSTSKDEDKQKLFAASCGLVTNREIRQLRVPVANFSRVFAVSGSKAEDILWSRVDCRLNTLQWLKVSDPRVQEIVGGCS